LGWGITGPEVDEAAVDSAVEAVSLEIEYASLWSLAGSPGEGFNFDRLE